MSETLTLAITPDQWENAAIIYARSGSAVKVARHLGLTVKIAAELIERGIPDTYAPLQETRDLYRAGKRIENSPVSLRNDAESQCTTLTHSNPQEPTRRNTPASANELAPLEPSPDFSSLARIDDSAVSLSAALERVHADLARALPRESALIGQYREQAIDISRGTSHLARAFEAIAARLSQRFIKAAERDLVGKSPQALIHLASLVRIVTAGAAAGRQAIELQRLISGLPQSIAATVGSPTAPIADAQAMLDTLERIQALKRNAVIDIGPIASYEGEESDK